MESDSTRMLIGKTPMVLGAAFAATANEKRPIPVGIGRKNSQTSQRKAPLAVTS
jgi:hypothetical protein